MGIIAFLVLGLLAGAIAKALMPGNDRGGILLTMALGVLGAFLGGFLGSVLFGFDPLDAFFDISTWVSAIAGSLVVLGIFRAVAGTEDSHRRDRI